MEKMPVTNQNTNNTNTTSTTNSTISTTGNTCVVCYKNEEIYSIGRCEHPVCYECSTRMRVLCRQNECPICRQDLPSVVFTKEIKPFDNFTKNDLVDRRYEIYFDRDEIRRKFYNLLANTCTRCRERPVFNDFHSLKLHMRHRHDLHYCDLCVQNLKIFSHERRCYTRSELATHKRRGDVDDKSHKGHPLCEFCDERYMDNDELYRHLRRDHLYCHFCDADGLHQYYSSYDYLRDHFKQEHYLCEEGSCVEEKFTSVFRTDIDLKVHKASVHSKKMSKAAAKQARTLELEFTLAPRDNRMNRRLSPSTSRDYNVRECQPATSVPSISAEQFPALGNAAPIVPPLNQSKGRGNLTIRSTMRPQLAITDENFPALGPELASAGSSKTVNFSLSSGNACGSSGSQAQKGSTSNVSIQVNHEPNGIVTTRVSGPNIRIRPAKLSVADFPALGCPEPSTSSTNSAHWKEVLQWTCSKSTPAAIPKPKKVASPPLIPSPAPTRSGEDFPTLSKPSKSKKQYTITVVPNWGQTQSSSNNNSSASSSSTCNMRTTTDMTKGKTKKKKSKPSNGNPGNDSENSKTNVSNDTAKKNGEVTKSTFKASNSAVVQSSSLSEHDNIDNVDNRENTSKSLNLQATKETEHSSKKEKKKNKNADGNSYAAALNKQGQITTANGVQRKRTELKIDSLNSTNGNDRLPEDFPALGSSGSSNPPGFMNPPPGFGNTVPPPPGFKLHNNNGLTFTNSSGETYSILPDSSKHNNTYSYLPPPDVHKRNESLVAKVNQVLTDQDRIDEFLYVSGLFRQGTCDAQDYYTHCQIAIGPSGFDSIFPELVVLLPDIDKQQELYKVYKQETDSKSRCLEACGTCGQVLKCGSDVRAHMASHTLENHFPLPGKSNAQPVKNSWPRK